MTLKSLTTSFPWARYSRKLASKITSPRNVGYFTKEESEERGMRLAEGIEGSIEEGNCIHFYWLVDKDDGIIVDVKFQVYGQSALIGAAEAACELLIGKNYDQARRITADLIDKYLQSRSGGESAFPPETYPHLNLVLDAIEKAADTCTDIPFASTYVAPPMPNDLGEVYKDGYPGWKTFTNEQKLSLIEQVLDRDIRPYIALDAGGVTVVALRNENELIISYQGSCTSCYSSVGATLAYIQKMIQAKVHPEIRVIPEV